MWFIIYSFIGWVYESVLCSILNKRIVNRGFLDGPICPIYGCGALIVIWAFYGRLDNILAIFILSAILTCFLEYITSYIMEQLFHTRWWNYSNRKFNINGRVCLEGMIIFGTFCTFLIKIIHPCFSKIINGYLNDNFMIVVSYVMIVIFAIDLTLTIIHIIRMNDRLKLIQDEYIKLKKQFETKKLKLMERQEDMRSDFELKIREKIESFENRNIHDKHLFKLSKFRKFQDKRILMAYPKLISRDHKEALDKLRERLLNKFK